MQPSSSRTVQITLLACAGLVLTAWLAAFELSQPLSLDHGIFVWAGDVIARGGLLYRDTWDHKGPLPYYFAAGVETLFGRTAWGLRAFDLAWQVAACVLVYAITRKLGGRIVAAAAAVLVYVAWYVALDYANNVQPDGWAGILLALCVLLLVARPKSAATPLLCGVIIGTCCLIKITFALFLLLPALYAPAPKHLRSHAAFVTRVAVGWLVPILLSVAFFAAHGILRDYYDASIGFNLDVYAGVQSFSLPMRLWLIFRMTFLSFRLAIPCLLALYGVTHLARRDGRGAVLIAVWVLGTIAHVFVQGKIVWLYHWLPVYPALAVAAALGVDAVLARWTGYRETHRSHASATASLALALGVMTLTVGWPAARAVGSWTSHVLLGSAQDGFDDTVYGWWGNGPHSMAAASHYIALRTTPDQFVLFGSSWALGNYLSNRPSPTRLMETRPYMDKPASPYSRMFLAEFLSAIAAHPPAYIVQGSPQLCGSDPYEARYCTVHFAQMQQLLSRCYVRAQRLGELDIWRRTCGHDGSRHSSGQTAG